MDVLPGSFASDWRRRRAVLLDEMERGRRPAAVEWDWLRRGGVTRLPAERDGSSRPRGRPFDSFAGGGSAPGERAMRARFEALARGSQPAVVKVSCYGPGSRAAGRLNYISRNGALTLEIETGERLAGKAALGRLRGEWEDLFNHRAATRDVAVFRLSIEAPSGEYNNFNCDEFLRHTLKSGLGDRRFVYGTRATTSGRLEIEGLVVLRDPVGNRLRGDAGAARQVQDLLDQDKAARAVHAAFSFDGHGHGLHYAAARMKDLMVRFDGKVMDESGREIATANEASALVRTIWRGSFHARRGRDFMHLIVSARAGTNAVSFTNAVRDFLGEQFAGHRYAFAMHHPGDDPKQTASGGKRPHLHAHAVVTMRSETGERLNPYIADFLRWRTAIAEKARQNGIAMEASDRRERASAPAFTRNQVRPLSFDGVTRHIGTSQAAQRRYDAKRADLAVIAGSARARLHAESARALWQEIAAGATDPRIHRHASEQADRIHRALREKDKAQVASLAAREIVGAGETSRGKENGMREMTRSEFQAYEKRVEAVLSEVYRSLDPSERARFDEIAAAARDVVDSRRDYLRLREVQERQQPVGKEASAERARGSGYPADRNSARAERSGEYTDPRDRAGLASPRQVRGEFSLPPTQAARHADRERGQIAERSETGREARER